MGETALYLSCHDASPDMEHVLPESFIRSCHLTGLRSNFQTDLLGSKCILMFRCVSTQGIRWCFAFSTFLSSKVIWKNVDPGKKQKWSQDGTRAMPPKGPKGGPTCILPPSPNTTWAFRARQHFWALRAQKGRRVLNGLSIGMRRPIKALCQP